MTPRSLSQQQNVETVCVRRLVSDNAAAVQKATPRQSAVSAAVTPKNAPNLDPEQSRALLQVISAVAAARF